MATAKQNFYKWHRILGLIALIPVMMWTLSGLSHPFMSNWFRPTIAREIYKSQPLQVKPALSLKQVLDKNKVPGFINFGTITYQEQPYYQVMGMDSTYQYYSANTGDVLANGDRLYATYLARYFTQDSTSKITSITIQKAFDAEYQPINHLLPVWKISFDRPDGMDVYIETGQSRMGTFNNNTRKAMLVVFEQLHTWQFLAAIAGEQFRVVVLLIIVGIMLLSLISGLTVYGLFWKKFKTATENRRRDKRKDTRFVHRFHRQLGLAVSLVMFTFTVSGAFHLYVKLANDKHAAKSGIRQMVKTAQLTTSNLSLPVEDSLVKNVGLVQFNGRTFYQLNSTKKQVRYFDVDNGAVLENGDAMYANYLASYYGAEPEKNVDGKVKTAQIREFTNEYGFINKRLPVQQISYPNGENWYVETTTSQLAAKVAGIDRAEGLSFIFLHKYFGMAWAGKNVRDIASMLAALGILVVSVFGFIGFLKNR
ncbi:PepSY domain-containing protein [Mucilaginibacter sp. 21P]|uniref:PepSY domain-containing protein n=1 Tax=Mucilaginibacter sp. 21P TaxID=2778902 RepID=UPI001C58BF04|nr:PepSY domain-containing protein [Mucilaginibacter sp. 21P]QXV66616.1 PepSY domain-containing protein [Mucilaginibacter sp. 21P]